MPEPEPISPRSRRSRRLRRAALVLAAAGLAAGLGVGLFTSTGSPKSVGGRPEVGQAAPTFTLPSLTGPGKVGLTDALRQGRPAVVLFFASWCSSCQAEVPAVAATYRSEQAHGSPLSKVAVIGVDGSDATSGLAFVKGSGAIFPVANDLSLGVTQGTYGLTGEPGAIYVNADGTVAGIHYGAITSAELVAEQHHLLKSA